MIFYALLSLLVPFGLGFAVVSLIWPGKTLQAGTFSIRIFTGMGLGLGLTSCTFFFWILADPGPVVVYGLLEILLLLGLILPFWRRFKDMFVLRPVAPNRTEIIFLLAFFLIGLSSILSLISLIRQNPHGLWDAFVIWNLRARFFFRAGVDWRIAFTDSLSWTHADYPLLLPLSVARAWTILSRESVFGPILTAIAFSLATLGLLMSSVTLFRGRIYALCSGILLLSTPFFILQTSHQYADIPVGFFFLSTFVFLKLHDLTEDQSLSFMVLAGLSAGCAAWTKNEGALFVCAVIAGYGLQTLWTQGKRVWLRRMAGFLVGLIPILAVLIYFKVALATGNDLLNVQSLDSMIRKILTPVRYLIACRDILSIGLRFGQWTISPVPFLALYALIVGLRKGRRGSSAGGLILSLGFMLLGYFFIYLITPHDIDWHLKNSFDRLLSQIWPCAILVCFSLTEAPQKRI